MLSVYWDINVLVEKINLILNHILTSFKALGVVYARHLHKMKGDVYVISRTKADLDSLEKKIANYFSKQYERGKSYTTRIYLFNVNNRRRCSGVFIVNFEHISHLVLVFLLLTLNM